MIRDRNSLAGHLRAIQAEIRDSIVSACERCATRHHGAGAPNELGDTTVPVEGVGGERLLELFGEIAGEWPLVLVAKGLDDPPIAALPEGTEPARAEIRVIIDPTDGSRGLAYQKRSGWVLTGVAPNYGPRTSLRDIEVAVQTEIPLVKQHLCDTLWAVSGEGTRGERTDRLTGERFELLPQPSRADTIRHGFGGLPRFVAGARARPATIEDRVFELALADELVVLKERSFEDQYISTGGQIYELTMGHDRWIADLRPLIAGNSENGAASGKPYDLCTELVAREAGILTGGVLGEPLEYPLDTTTNVAWTGYANRAVRDQVFSALLRALREAGLEVPERIEAPGARRPASDNKREC